MKKSTIMLKLSNIMQIATEAAYKRSLISNACNGHAFVGCIVMDTRGNIIAQGINVYGVKANGTSAHGVYDNTCSIHAEHNAIIALNNYLRRRRLTRRQVVNIVVYRTNKAGTHILNAKPCSSCVRIMYDDQRYYKINRVYYTTQNGDIAHL